MAFVLLARLLGGYVARRLAGARGKREEGGTGQISVDQNSRVVNQDSASTAILLGDNGSLPACAFVLDDARRRGGCVARRLRIDLDMRPPRALPAAHFERNETQGI